MIKKLLLIFCFIFWGNAMALTLQSWAFKHGELIPKVYTCDGTDASPPLQWSEVPAGTKSFVLIMDDPDAPKGVWDHWILFNIPPTTTELDENLRTLPTSAMAGNNSWNKAQYGGPCPPDKEHRYFFRLYALDTVLNLKPGATKNEVAAAMKGHIIGNAELMGRYNRRR